MKGVATTAQTYSSKKVPAGNRRFEMNGFMVMCEGEMHGRELEEERTGESQ